MEKWRSVFEYEGRYQVSSYGRVRSVTRISFIGRQKYAKTFKSVLMSQNDHVKGYKIVFLNKPQTKRKKFFVHRLVAIAFHPNPSEKPIVNHKDSNKHNNRTCNLEWMSESENTQHYYDNREPVNRDEVW